MMNYKVSILIPIYNVSSFIIRCLKSVSLQTYDGDLECILVDDCGTDNSIVLAGEFIESYQGKVSFRIIHHEHNRGWLQQEILLSQMPKEILFFI